MSINGIIGLNSKLRRHQYATERGLRKGLLKAGLALQRESQKIVPIDTGVLRNSASTRLEDWGFQSKAIVGYETDYAIYVHEDLEARHKPGKQAKYLEQPLREHSDRLIGIVIKEINKETGGIGR